MLPLMGGDEITGHLKADQLRNRGGVPTDVDRAVPLLPPADAHVVEEEEPTVLGKVRGQLAQSMSLCEVDLTEEGEGKMPGEVLT